MQITYKEYIPSTVNRKCQSSIYDIAKNFKERMQVNAHELRYGLSEWAVAKNGFPAIGKKY